MEEKVVKTVEGVLWIEKSPLALTRWILVEDEEKLFYKIEFTNLSEKEIEAVYLDVLGMNVLKQELDAQKEVALLDLNLLPGKKVLVKGKKSLADNSIRNLKFTLRHVVFKDEESWNYDGDDYLALYSDNMQEDIPQEYSKDVDELMSGIGLCGKYYKYPVYKENFWMCACGQLNIGGSCISCRVQCDFLKQNFNEEKFIHIGEVRAEKERLEGIARAERLELIRAERERNLKIAEEERQTRELARKQAVDRIKNTTMGIVEEASQKSAELGNKFTEMFGKIMKKDEKSSVSQTPTPINGQKLFCSECGSKLIHGARFCGKCGSKVD